MNREKRTGGKNRIKGFLLLLLTCLLLFAAGCQSNKTLTVDTQLVVDDSFAGERVMIAEMTEREFQSFYGGTLEEFNSLMSEYAPDDVECIAETSGEEDETICVTISISFNSYEDYEEKLEEIFSGSENYEEGSVPAIYFEYANSMFKQGFIIEEDFSSADLLYWLVDALIEADVGFSEKNQDDILVDGTVELIFEEETFSCEDKINAANIEESSAFDSITVETTLNDDDTYDVEIDYYAQATVMEALGDELIDFMYELTPEDASFSSKTTAEGTIFTIQLTATDEEDYVDKLNEALYTNNTEFEVSEESGDADTLQGQKKIISYLDGSYFLDFSNDDSYMTYIFKATAEHSFEDCESARQYIVDYSYESTDNDSSTTVIVSPSDEITLYLGYSVDIEQVNVETTMNSRINYVRNLKFTLTNTQSENYGERFEERIEARLSEGMTFEQEESESGEVVYTVTISASSASELSELTCAFLDGNSDSGASLLESEESEEDQIHHITYVTTDRIDFSTFLSGSELSNGIYYSFEYPLGYTGYFIENSNYEESSEDGNALTCLTYNKVLEVSTYARILNLEGILTEICFVASFVVLVVLLISRAGAIVRCVKKKKFDLAEFDLYNKKGYRKVTIFVVALVIFAFSFIRLWFEIY